MEEVKSFKSKTEKEIRIHKIQFKDKVPIPNIEYSENHELPEKLIKYYRADEYGYKVIRDKKVWASHPLSFNDPFDCSIPMWNIDTFPFEDTRDKLNEIFKRDFSFKKDDYEIRRTFVELMLRSVGIFCLNEGINSDLFWGYYSNHNGFSVVFDTNVLNSCFGSNPFKLEYKKLKNSDKISLVSNDLESYDILPKILRWLTLKKTEWIHENEWRYIFFDINIENTNRAKNINISAIKEIILGFKFFKSLKKREKISFFITKYFFDNDFLKGYSFKILETLLGYPDIILKQVALTEDFKLFNQRVFVRELTDKYIIIERE